jgi:hypothetical protein
MNNVTIEILGTRKEKVLDLYINQEGRFMEASFTDSVIDDSVDRAIELLAQKGDQYKIPSIILNFKSTTAFETLPSASWLVNKVHQFKESPLTRVAVVLSNPVLGQVDLESLDELFEKNWMKMKLFKTSVRAQAWLKNEATGIIVS